MLLVLLALVAAAVTTGLLSGHVLAGASGAGLLLVAWLAKDVGSSDRRW